MSANPVLIEVTRGGVVESFHRAAIVVAAATGEIVMSVGDIGRPVFPRSAIKALQAVPLIESGAAGSFGFHINELALACASHSGERRHVETARSMLRKAGINETALECGPHWPPDAAAARELAAQGATPTALHNNCSGKHAGMLATAKHLGYPLKDYTQPDHPLQRDIADILSAMTGEALKDAVCGVDGCSVPTWGLSLRGWARAFAAFISGQGLTKKRAGACRLLRDSCMGAPFMVAGAGRFCTRLMLEFRGDVFAKTGAEGVYCAALPEQNLGIALKIDDGAKRASEVLLANVLAALMPAQKDRLDPFTSTPQHNCRNIETGTIRLAAGAHDLLKAADRTLAK